MLARLSTSGGSSSKTEEEDLFLGVGGPPTLELLSDRARERPTCQHAMTAMDWWDDQISHFSGIGRTEHKDRNLYQYDWRHALHA